MSDTQRVVTPTEDVRAFWNASPCGSETSTAENKADYFREIEAFRYSLEPHILEVVPFSIGRDKDVLEVGCGVGTDAAQWAKAGARYTGMDLTPEAARLSAENLQGRNLQGYFLNADAEKMPFPDNSFDIVYSHGVIHHSPNIEKVVSEIHRVLRPGGHAILMVYHRHSYNYYLNILFFRRLGIALLLLPGGVSLVHKLTHESREVLESHKKIFHEKGLRYLGTQEFLNANTDGPGNPLSRVYSRKEAGQLLKAFHSLHTEIRYLNRRRLPILGKLLPESWHDWLSRRWGWHLYLFATK